MTEEAFPRIHEAVVEGAKAAISSWLELHTGQIVLGILIIAAISGFVGGIIARRSV